MLIRIIHRVPPIEYSITVKWIIEHTYHDIFGEECQQSFDVKGVNSVPFFK